MEGRRWRKPKPTDAEIEEGMSNLYRCASYVRICEAMKLPQWNGVSFSRRQQLD
jgi:hypothetical protein